MIFFGRTQRGSTVGRLPVLLQRFRVVLMLSTRLVLSQWWFLIYMFPVLIHWWVEVLHADRTTSMCLWTTKEPRARLLQLKTGLSPHLITADRSKAVLLLWLILLIGVTKLIGGGLLYIRSSFFYYCLFLVFYNICNEPQQNPGRGCCSVKPVEAPRPPPPSQ